MPVNLQHEFQKYSEKKLADQPIGTKASYVGGATITLIKQHDGNWHLESLDCGITRVNNSYVASKNPVIEEAI